jgi:hypothetical protein
MIIVRLRGGLGNQLFQFAAGYALSQHHKVELKLDLYTYSRHKYRRFELENLKIPFSIATRSEIHHFTGNNPLKRFLNKRENYLRCPLVFSQPHYHYFENFLSLPADLYLSGYWQSEKYFLAVKDQIQKFYQAKTQLDHNNAALSDQFSQVNSVAVHVRRGDYTSATYSGFFGGISDTYYTEAIQRIKEKTDNPVFFIFSDNIEWCKNNLDVQNARYIDHNRGADSYKDLILMSQAKHNIIANSTFSWWAAWLNSNTKKMVIAPKQWFRKDYYEVPDLPVYASRLYNTNDLIPSVWTRL